MHDEREADNHPYKVVTNYAGEYSIWITRRTVPAGWREVGKQGGKEECLAYINEVWTDMRPRSQGQYL